MSSFINFQNYLEVFKKFTLTVFPEEYIDKFKKPFVKFHGATPFEMIKHPKRQCGMLDDTQKVALK